MFLTLTGSGTGTAFGVILPGQRQSAPDMARAVELYREGVEAAFSDIIHQPARPSYSDPELATLTHWRGIVYTGNPVDPMEIGIPIVIDLASLKYTLPMPLLIDHDEADFAGWADEVHIGRGMMIANGRVINTMAGRHLRARIMHNWQASIGTTQKGGKVGPEMVPVIVNEKHFGPMQFIARGYTMNEISITDRPADPGTGITMSM